MTERLNRLRRAGSVLVLAGALLLLLAVRFALLHSHRGPDLPADKQAARKRTEALEALARKAPRAPKPEHPTPPPGAPDPEPEGGVLAGDAGPLPFPARRYTIENRWLGKLDGNLLVVYAAAETENPDQGLLVVFWPDGRQPYQVYRMPQPQGCPTITGVEGHTINLTVPGARFTFDLDTHAFAAP